MKAIVYRGIERVELEDIPKPVIEKPTDALLRVTTSAICGSDLHTYRQERPQSGLAMGHEFMGIIEEIGSQVGKFKIGDRVVLPFSVNCGQCWFCHRNWPTQCVNWEVFGSANLSGGQAEYVRIPFADAAAVHIPEDVPDEEAIFLGDIFSTGYFCAENGGIRPGDYVAVVGCGPVGLFAQMGAQLFGPGAVMAVDVVPTRLDIARQIGSLPINAAEVNARDEVLRLTDGRGADVVLEAVGAEGSAFKQAFELVRGGGTVSMVGVPTEDYFPFPIRQGFREDLTFKIGVCPARRYIPQLLPLLQNKKVNLSQIVSHVMPLDEAVEGFRMFNRRDPGVVKILLKP